MATETVRFTSTGSRRRAANSEFKYWSHCPSRRCGRPGEGRGSVLDDIAGQAAKAATKTAGIVIDDTAVTPRYLTEFAAARELAPLGRGLKTRLRRLRSPPVP